jgi:Sec-independent protein translocase protein TatA
MLIIIILISILIILIIGRNKNYFISFFGFLKKTKKKIKNDENEFQNIKLLD